MNALSYDCQGDRHQQKWVQFRSIVVYWQVQVCWWCDDDGDGDDDDENDFKDDHRAMNEGQRDATYLAKKPGLTAVGNCW